MHKDFLIEKFLSHTLSEKELIEFKERWATDTEFAEEVRGYAGLAVALQANDHLEKNKKNEKDLPKTKTGRGKTAFYYSLAASIALILIAVPIYMVINSPSSEDLATANLIDYRLQGVRGGNDTGANNVLNRVLRACGYQQKPKAIAILQKAIKDEKDNDMYFFILGDLYLTTNQPDSAIFYYKQGGQLNNNDPYTQWNVIMAKLQKGEIDASRTMLEQMVTSAIEPYAQKAKNILEKMDSPSFKIKMYVINAVRNKLIH